MNFEFRICWRNLLFVVACIVFMFCVCSSSVATRISALPYQARSIDECINEKACLKYIFLSEVFKGYSEGVSFDLLPSLAKWQNPIYVGIIGVPASTKLQIDGYGMELIKLVHDIMPYYTNELIVTDDKGKINAAIILSYAFTLNELKEDSGLTEYFSSDFLKILQKNLSEGFPQVVKVSKKNAYYAGVVLDEIRGNENVCLLGYLTALLGVNETPSDHFNLVDYKDCELSNIQRFNLTLLQMPEVRIGMNVQEASEVFDAVYGAFEGLAKSYDMELSELMKERADSYKNKHYITR
jgi:hypothetical protein